jgi:cysteinyl-tRNA synthetase
LYYKTASSAFSILSHPDTTTVEQLYIAMRDILAFHLDATLGSTVTDPKVFRDFAAYWETDYLADMRALNVSPPDVLTRVSEYVPEIVEFVDVIVKKGLAYEADGSVYFDTAKFSENHEYAKLCPWAKG